MTGKLGGHTGIVMAVVVSQMNNNTVVYTGSRDHYVKVVYSLVSHIDIRDFQFIPIVDQYCTILPILDQYKFLMNFSFQYLSIRGFGLGLRKSIPSSLFLFVYSLIFCSFSFYSSMHHLFIYPFISFYFLVIYLYIYFPGIRSKQCASWSSSKSLSQQNRTIILAAIAGPRRTRPMKTIA